MRFHVGLFDREAVAPAGASYRDEVYDSESQDPSRPLCTCDTVAEASAVVHLLNELCGAEFAMNLKVENLGYSD